MNEPKKNASLWTQVAVALLIALVAGGTAPWWWHEFFNGDTAGQTAGNQVQKATVPGFVGAAYEVECRDNKERNVFRAILQFTSKDAARWRYSEAANWSDVLRVEALSRHKLVLSGGSSAEQQAWNLEFSDDFARVSGSYRFLQTTPSPARWRNYVVAGSRLR
jgi:hypothetical protein